MFNNDEKPHNAAKYLDTLDLSSVLKECEEEGATDSWKVRKKLGKISDEVYKAIDCLTQNELMMYLETKYRLTFVEKYSYEMFLEKDYCADSLKREEKQKWVY